MERLLSIIIPLYNSERYIERCIYSVMELQLPKEIIIVDDGSTDDSYRIVKRCADDGLVRLYRQENKGVSEARNLGLNESCGDIIAFVDSDDYVDGDSFEKLYSQFLESEADMAMGGVKIVFSQDRTETRQATDKMQGLMCDGQHCFASLMRSNTFTPLVFSYLFRKSFIEHHKMRFRHRMSEDDLWTSIAMCEAKHILISDVLHYVYCKHSDSITGANSVSIFRADNHIAVANDLYDYLLTHKLEKDAEVWLCCKILYIASIAVKIYIDNKYYSFNLSLEMYQDLFKRVMSSIDEYAKKVGLMFGMRLINTIKSMKDLI